MATPPISITYEADIALIDHAGKVSHMTFLVSQADYAAWLTDTTAGNVRTTMNALEALSLDNVLSETVSARAGNPINQGIPSSEGAVNSAKLLILMADAVNGEAQSRTIPARNTANYTSVRGQVITGAGATTQIAALVTAVTAHFRSDDGNGVNLKEIRVVGRGTAA